MIYSTSHIRNQLVSMSLAFLVNYVTGRLQITKIKSIDGFSGKKYKLYDKNKLIFVGKNHSDFILIRDTAMSQYISGPGGSMS
jgi:hypothetical protein